MAGGQRHGHVGPRSEELLEILPASRLEIEGREAQMALLRGDDPGLVCAVERDVARARIGAWPPPSCSRRRAAPGRRQRRGNSRAAEGKKARRETAGPLGSSECRRRTIGRASAIEGEKCRSLTRTLSDQRRSSVRYSLLWSVWTFVRCWFERPFVSLRRRAFKLFQGIHVTLIAIGGLLSAGTTIAAARSRGPAVPASAGWIGATGGKLVVARGPVQTLSARTATHVGRLSSWVRPRSRGARPTLTWGKTRLRFTHALPRGRWTRVAVTWDASSVRLFLDGHAVERDAFGAPDLGGAWHALSFGTTAAVDLRGAALVDAAHAPPLPAIAKPTASAHSRAVAVAAAVPGNTALPTISGTAKDAQTLTATNGTWSGSPTSYAKQWQRCDSAGANCTNISGATAATYVLASADVGSKIRVKVTATNASGSASATSAARPS